MTTRKEYADVIKTLVETAKRKGKSSAKLGSDCVVTFTAEYLRALLKQAEAAPDKTITVALLERDNVLKNDAAPN